MSDLQARAPRQGFFAALWTLIAMQLKEKMDLSFLRSGRKTLFKIVWLLGEFAAVTAICYLVIYLVKLLGISSKISLISCI